MAQAVTTNTKDLPDSRVRVDVEVEPGAVEQELQRAATQLGRELKMPGFRKGKVPPQVVMQRVGRQTVLDEAVRSALPAWYEAAVADAGLATVGEPKVDLEGLPDQGAPLSFSIEIGVRPVAQLGEYKGLEVGRREPEVTDEEIDAEVERLRESLASLETVERPAAKGDFVVLDFVGRVGGEPFEGGEARGYLLELGTERLIPGFEEQLEGATAGEDRDVKVTFPGDYGNEELAGQDAVFSVSVKEVKEKRLPELDDELAAEAGGFDTLDELGSDIKEKVSEAKEIAIEREFREAAVDAAADAATVDLPEGLVHAKAHEMWHATTRALERRGISAAQYAQVSGKTEHELIEEAEPDAERSLRREAALAAIVEAEGIQPTDAEILEALREAAAAQGGGEISDEELEASLARAKEQGRDEALRQDIAMRKAVDLLVEHAEPIALGQAEAREKLWTPEKERAEAAGKLWTPGS